MMEYAVGLLVVTVLVVAYSLRSDFEHYAITSTGVYKRIRRYDIETEESCTACGENVADGELRKASKEIVVLGCPLYRTETVANYYCNSHSSFEYQQGETVTPTKERLIVAIGTVLALIEPVEAHDEPEFQQLQSSISASFHLIPIAFLVVVAAAVIGTVKAFGGEL